MRFAWAEFFEIYCVAFALQGAIAAMLLYVVGFSPRETIGPIFARLRGDKRRAFILLPFLLVLYALCAQIGAATVWPLLSILSIAVLELFDRTRGKHVLSSRLVTLSFCACYLFWGLVLVSAYNDIAIVSRVNVTFDGTFNRFDSWLMHGMTVSEIAHLAVRALPGWSYTAIEFIYYSCMFPQVGGALLLLAFRCGREESFRFVVAVLTAYYFAVVLFWLCPSQGPFVICNGHFTNFPSSLRTYSIQRILSEKVASLWAGHGIGVVGLDYYIAFPSMHIAIPVIIAIYLRRWRRVFATVLAIDCLILCAVVLLEWHYVVDIAGGLIVAFVVALLVPPHNPNTDEVAQSVTNSSAQAR